MNYNRQINTQKKWNNKQINYCYNITKKIILVRQSIKI